VIKMAENDEEISIVDVCDLIIKYATELKEKILQLPEDQQKEMLQTGTIKGIIFPEGTAKSGNYNAFIDIEGIAQALYNILENIPVQSSNNAEKEVENAG
jgi:hypothetical protein